MIALVIVIIVILIAILAQKKTGSVRFSNRILYIKRKDNRSRASYINNI